MTVSTRAAAMAGLFYPADARQLQRQIRTYLNEGGSRITPDRPLAIITPHAGYIYSGPTAGVAWAQAATRKDEIQRVMILGPSHRVAFRGIATSPADYWKTPLGTIELDGEAAGKLQELPFVSPLERAHAQEHCLEVQVPFIQILFPEAKLLPLVVGEATPQDMADVIRPYWNDRHTLIAISSDLSHFHSYQTAQQIDSTTTRAIEQCDYAAIGPEQACGYQALNGLLKLVEEAHRSVKTLDLCNSGDTAGDRQRVVGYGAYVVH